MEEMRVSQRGKTDLFCTKTNQQSRVQNLVQTKEQQIVARKELLRNANRCWAFSADA